MMYFALFLIALHAAILIGRILWIEEPRPMITRGSAAVATIIDCLIIIGIIHFFL